MCYICFDHINGESNALADVDMNIRTPWEP